LWVCKGHYDLLQQINNNRSIELGNQMADIFSSSWSTSSHNISNDSLSKNNLSPNISNDSLTMNSLSPLIQNNQRESSNSLIQSGIFSFFLSFFKFKQISQYLSIKLDKKTFILNHQGSKYKIKNCSSLEEVKQDVQKQTRLESQTFDIEYLDTDGEYYVAADFDDLKDVTNLRIKN